MTKQDAVMKAKAAARKFAEAAIERSWLGSKDPADHQQIRDRYVKAEKSLDKALDNLYDRGHTSGWNDAWDRVETDTTWEDDEMIDLGGEG